MPFQALERVAEWSAVIALSDITAAKGKRLVKILWPLCVCECGLVDVQHTAQSDEVRLGAHAAAARGSSFFSHRFRGLLEANALSLCLINEDSTPLQA